MGQTDVRLSKLGLENAKSIKVGVASEERCLQILNVID